MQKEIEYNFVSTQGSVNQSTLDGWEGYLQQFRDYIIKGTHFSNFAVQARERERRLGRQGGRQLVCLGSFVWWELPCSSLANCREKNGTLIVDLYTSLRQSLYLSISVSLQLISTKIYHYF